MDYIQTEPICKSEYTSCSEIVLWLRFFIAEQMARGESAGVTLRIIHIPGDWNGEWSRGRGEDDK